MKVGSSPPTLDAALDRVARIAPKLERGERRRWAADLLEIVARLTEGSEFGPKHSRWHLEARRLWLAADIAELALNRRRAFIGAKALTAQLPCLEEAVDADDQLEVAAIRLGLEAVIDEEVEQERLRPDSPMDPEGKSVELEGKAMLEIAEETPETQQRSFQGCPIADPLPPRPIRKELRHREEPARPAAGRKNAPQN